jgi:uncharacterized protein
MLLVETYLASSNIQGIGLFAAQDIKKGAKIWVFTPGFDLKFTDKNLEELSPAAKRQFFNYCYKSKNGIYVLCFDDARFINHSESPNTLDDDDEEGVVTAAVDIKRGNELTTNYWTYDTDTQMKLSGKYRPLSN